MPDRIIRDELLTSERYWSVCNEAKLLYLHLLLCADDTARYTGKNFSLRTKCFAGQAISADLMEQILNELVSQDLVRLYEVDNERYVFIPRFRQRLRFKNSKFPAPPSEITDLLLEKSDLSQTQDRLKPDSSQAQDSRSEVKRREVLQTPKPTVSTDGRQKNKTPPKPDDIEQSVWDDFVAHRKRKRGAITALVMQSIREEAAKAGWSLDNALKEIIVRNWQTFKSEWVGKGSAKESIDQFAGVVF